MKIQLTLTVDYSPNGATSELLALTLEQAAEHLFNEEWLAGNTGAEVNSVEAAVEILSK